MSNSDSARKDVFLSHNSKDKPLIRRLRDALVSQGLAVWLDEDELQPGMTWQRSVELAITNVKSVIVAVGEDGIGPWEDEEMQAALIAAVNKGIPVIPVFIGPAASRPKLPMFLQNRTWVSLHPELRGEDIARIVWGITGAKPTPMYPLRRKRNASGPQSAHEVMCTLNCIEKGNDVLHGRNSAFLKTLCDKFPDAEFRLTKFDEDTGLPEEPIDLRSVVNIWNGAFRHGDRLRLEVSGKLQVTAAAFLKTALENLSGFSDDPAATTARIVQLNDELNKHLYDPDLDAVEYVRVRREDLLPAVQECRSLAIINDRLHDVSLPMIPLVAKHFGCELHLGFELADKGVFMFNMGAQNGYTLERRILELDIPIGTRITVITSGANAEKANAAVKNVLQNLWQCDHWIRNRPRDWDAENGAPQVMSYAREMARDFEASYGPARKPRISSLVTQSTFVNAPGQSFSKHSALEQLASSHARLYDLSVEAILQSIEDVERSQTVVPRPGFAIAHAAMSRTPRISISFGTYPDGVLWSERDGIVKLVAMVICAADTYRTWRDYLREFAVLFRTVPDLQSRLVAARKSTEFIKILRSAELSSEEVVT